MLHSTISNRHSFVSFQARTSVQQAILLRMYSIIDNHGCCTIALCFTTTSDISRHLRKYFCVSKDTFCSPKGIHVSQRLDCFLVCVSMDNILIYELKGINSSPRKNFVIQKKVYELSNPVRSCTWSISQC